MGQAIEVASADEDLLKALSSLSAQGARLTGKKTRPIAYEPPLEGGVLSEFSLRPQENKCKHSCDLIPRDCPRREDGLHQQWGTVPGECPGSD